MHRQARRLVALQVLVTLALALIVRRWWGEAEAISALLGGAVGFVPAWIYAWRMSAVAGQDPQDLLRAQYRAEFYKFAATAVMFALSFVLFREMSALFLFLAYLATLTVYWVALVMS